MTATATPSIEFAPHMPEGGLDQHPVNEVKNDVAAEQSKLDVLAVKNAESALATANTATTSGEITLSIKGLLTKFDAETEKITDPELDALARSENKGEIKNGIIVDNVKENSPDFTLEEDSRYQEIKTKMANEWMSRNGKNDMMSSEAQMFITGDGSKRGSLSLHDRIVEEYKTQYPDSFSNYQTKVYSEPSKDPLYQKMQKEAQDTYGHEVANAGRDKRNPRPREMMGSGYYDTFVQDHPDKALAYSTKNPEIQKAIERKNKRTEATVTSKGQDNEPKEQLGQSAKEPNEAKLANDDPDRTRYAFLNGKSESGNLTPEEATELARLDNKFQAKVEDETNPTTPKTSNNTPVRSEPPIETSQTNITNTNVETSQTTPVNPGEFNEKTFRANMEADFQQKNLSQEEKNARVFTARESHNRKVAEYNSATTPSSAVAEQQRARRVEVEGARSRQDMRESRNESRVVREQQAERKPIVADLKAGQARTVKTESKVVTPKPATTETLSAQSETIVKKVEEPTTSENTVNQPPTETKPNTAEWKDHPEMRKNFVKKVAKKSYDEWLSKNHMPDKTQKPDEYKLWIKDSKSVFEQSFYEAEMTAWEEENPSPNDPDLIFDWVSNRVNHEEAIGKKTEGKDTSPKPETTYSKSTIEILLKSVDVSKLSSENQAKIKEATEELNNLPDEDKGILNKLMMLILSIFGIVPAITPEKPKL